MSVEPATAPLPEPGEAIGERYRVEAQLGRGGMAVVYRAQDVLHDRVVAVKVLRPEIARAVGAERFLREIEIESHLSHPHVLPLLDAGQSGDLLYAVMPLAEGGSLRDRLTRERQLPVPEAVDIALEVADALGHAHARGVVHRDVKPENILFHGGHAALTDFGVARMATQAADRLTATGVAVGTPAYMSPEQAAADPELDGRSDIYALGCVLYEMLGGEPPFGGPSAQVVIRRHLHDTAPPLDILRPAVPEGVLCVVERALEKVPADRYPTLEAFSADLRAGRDTPPRTHSRGGRWGRAAGAVAVLVVVAMLVGLRLVRTPALYDDRLVVFPLLERANGLPAGEGLDVALGILRGLEHADWMTVADGWELLQPNEREDPSDVTARRTRAIARDRGARFYITGVVRSIPESVVVTLRLHDAAADTLVTQRSAAASLGGRAGLTALTKVLPAIVDPGRRVDLAPLLDRDPAAVASWLRGERAYRSSHFAEALSAFEQAVALDSGLVMAAVRGAQAASWRADYERTTALVEVALERPDLLPEAYRLLANGLRAYVAGMADSAVSWLARLRDRRPDWAEGRMALGEVYYHLLPSVPSADSLALVEFRAALAADRAFSPALMHLAEDAGRRGLVDSLGHLLKEFRSREADSLLVLQLQLLHRCLAAGPDAEWQRLAGAYPGAALRAGMELGIAQPPCAERMLRAATWSPLGDERTRWWALLALQGLLVGLGRYDEATALLDSAVAAGESGAYSYYVIGTLAGAPMRAGVQALQDLLMNVLHDDLTAFTDPGQLWLLGVWYAAEGDVRRFEQVAHVLRAKARESGTARAASFVEALRGHEALLLGDTAEAIRRLAQVTPAGPRSTFPFERADPLPVERLRLAQLRLAVGDAVGAIAAAAVFDHPSPIVFWEFALPSLALRREAARALHDAPAADHYARRLAGLQSNRTGR